MYKSNMNKFFEFNEAAVNKALDRVGRDLKNKITDATPIDTGNLASRNNYDVQNKVLTLYNTAEYAPYVELGTIFQNANPFYRDTIYRNLNEIVSIMKEELKV